MLRAVNRRATLRGALAIAGLALLAACGGGDSKSAGGPSAAAAKAERTTLRRGNGPEPDTVDPQLARTDGAFNILRDLFEGLTAVGPDGQAVPAAAESWDVSPDGLEYTFHLRAASSGRTAMRSRPAITSPACAGWSRPPRRRRTRSSSILC